MMVAVLLAAAFLRLVAWQSAPPGLRYDEMTVVYEADEIRAGARPIYMDGSAEEALYHYFFAVAQEALGAHAFTLRWLAAAFGLIAVAATFALGRQMFNTRVGLLAATLAAASFWALMYSRVGLRIIGMPAFVTLAMLFLWRGLTHVRRRDFIIAGVLFGLSAYIYAATRMLPVVFVGFLVYLAILKRAQLRTHGLYVMATFVVAIVIVLPMAIHIATVPAAERRLGEVEGPLDALQRGEIQPLINSTLITAAMFIAKGDPEWLYNIPDRPVFDLVTGIIFYGALFLCLRRFKHSPYAFVIIWLIAGLLPAMLTWPAASNSHGILAQTPTFLIAAIGIDAIAAKVSATKQHEKKVTGLVLGSVLAIHSVVSINDYFNRWAIDPTVQIEHQANVAATARYLGQHPATTPLVFSSGEVTHYNPWSVTSFRLNAPLGYTNARWFDARSSFIFPQGQTDLTLIMPVQDDVPAPLDARLIEDLFPTVEPSPLATEIFSATHLVSSLTTRLITLTQASVSWPDGSAAQLPLAIDDRLELIGYDVRRSTVEIGKNIRLTTYWRAQNLGLEPLSIFVHVLDDQGRVDAQWDGFTIAPEYVQRGDVIVQVHFIPIPPDFAPGTYQLVLGMYEPRTAAQPRLPIVAEGQPKTDRILLQSVQMINAQ